MSKDMEFFNHEPKINEIKHRGIESKNHDEIRNCINELCELRNEFDNNKYADNYELFNLIEKAIRELHAQKK